MTWIRLRDTTTGHEFDANERLAAELVDGGAAEVVPDAPEHHGSDARPPSPSEAFADAWNAHGGALPATTPADVADSGSSSDTAADAPPDDQGETTKTSARASRRRRSSPHHDPAAAPASTPEE
jgi:hypothetical protein